MNGLRLGPDRPGLGLAFSIILESRRIIPGQNPRVITGSDRGQTSGPDNIGKGAIALVTMQQKPPARIAQRKPNLVRPPFGLAHRARGIAGMAAPVAAKGLGQLLGIGHDAPPSAKALALGGNCRVSLFDFIVLSL